MYKLLPILLLLCYQVYASPNKNVDYLMGTPITLWDWGRFKIDQELKQIEHDQEDIYIGCSTMYLWEKDSLEIRCSGARYGDKYLSVEEGQALKNEIIEKVRLYLGYFFSGNFNSYEHMRSKQAYIKDSYPIEKYFQHLDFQLKSFPEGLGKSLERITKIVTHIQDFENGGAYLCEATLQGNMPMCNFMTAEDISKTSRNLFN